MRSLRRYPTQLAAHEAVQALRAAGILATVVGETDALSDLGVGSGYALGRFLVLLDDTARYEEAGRLLDELDAHPAHADPGWEEDASAPDLSRLDPGLSIPCPLCMYDLRAQARTPAGQATCPECGGVVSVLEAVLGSHGPEALGPCYPEPVDPLPDAVVDASVLFCRRCRYPLAGLPRESHCPECGLPYSKRAMLRR
jgi:hypothetical protein